MNDSLPISFYKSCVQLRDGTYYFRKQIAGKRFHRSLKVRNLADAISKAKELYHKFERERNKATQGNQFNAEITLGEAAELLLATKHSTSESGIKYYKDLKIQIVREFGMKYKLNQLNMVYANDYVQKLVRLEYAPRTIRHRVKFLKQIYKNAVLQGIYHENPVANLQSPKIVQEKPVFLLKTEIPTFLEMVTDYDRLPSFMALKTGMRKGEICKLKWEMVDFNNDLITLPALICKNGKSRSIPLDADLKVALMEHRSNSFSTLPHVFLNKEQTGPRTDIRKGVVRVFKKMGRTDLCFHSLRKTFATFYLEQNPDDIKGLMDICGWADIKTASIYLGITDQMQKVRSNRINSSIPFAMPVK
jgi:integrase